MTPCATFTARDKAREARHKFDELVDELRHGNEANWELMLDIKELLCDLEYMLESDCEDIIEVDDDKELEDIFKYWLDQGKDRRS